MVSTNQPCPHRGLFLFYFRVILTLHFNLFLITKVIYAWSSHRGSAVMNPTSIHEDADSIPGPAQWVKAPVLL